MNQVRCCTLMELVLNGKNRNKTPIPHANMESNTGDEAAKANEIKKIDAQVSIHLHSKRHKLADADGLCAKWVIDSIVSVGILQDDSPKEVKSVSYSQEKVTKNEPEETIITIEWE